MEKIYPVNSYYQTNGLISKEDYQTLYVESITEPDTFWARIAKRIDWYKPFTQTRNVTFNDEVLIEWYKDGKLNISYNCIDRHLSKNGNRIAYYFEPDDETTGKAETITYQQLHDEVCRVANILKNMGVKKGDRVTIYLPMIPFAVYSMLACARIGAIHSVIFAGFSPSSITDRVNDCDSQFIITADEGRRGGKIIHLKNNVDEALLNCSPSIKTLLIKHTGGPVNFNSQNNFWYHDEVKKVSAHCEPEIMDAEDPLFILYTSGSTGKPKGVLHTTGGYLVYAAFTHEYIFNYSQNDIYWCTADVGWVTGHSYIVYGPLANGASSILFEGVPNYPDFSRHWKIVDKYKVNIYYTAPTLIRSLMAQGDQFVHKYSRKSLKLLGSVGEPINPQAWEWYHKTVGDGRCPIVDTWWQTETGGILISPLPGATDLKPGSATLPFFGIEPLLVDEHGKELQGETKGNLCLRTSWPGQMRTVYKDHARFKQTYFSTYKGLYFTGDGAIRDRDGYYWITGRVDDVLNVSGHRLGTAEIESAFVLHAKVAEAAVVGVPHDIKGQAIYAYVTLKLDVGNISILELKKELVNWISHHLSPIAKPDFIHFTPALPKTRSGKIMRRILRKIACNEFSELGDITTLADPTIVEKLISERQNI